MAEETYIEQRNDYNRRMIRETIQDMPDYIERYMENMMIYRKYTTCLGYAVDIKTFFTWISQKKLRHENPDFSKITLPLLESLEFDDFQAFLAYIKNYKADDEKRQNSASALRRKLSAIRSLYTYLVQSGRIKNNPAASIKMPKVDRKEVIRMEPNETAQFLDNVEYGLGITERQQKHHDRYKIRDLAILTLLLATGIRVSECVGLNIKDVDFDDDRILVTRKGGKREYVYFGQECRGTLLDYMEEREKIDAKEGHAEAFFLSNRNTRITVRSIELLVKKYSKTATGKEITPHKLRSTFGTSLYNATGDIYLVATTLGHDSINNTKRYTLQEESQKRAVKDLIELREKK